MNEDRVADILNSNYQRHRHTLCQLAISVCSAHLHCDHVSDAQREPHKPPCYKGSRRLQPPVGCSRRREANHRKCFMVSNKGNSAVPVLLYFVMCLALLRPIHTQKTKNKWTIMFGGHRYAGQSTSLVLLHWVALWLWPACPRPALVSLLFPGMVRATVLGKIV